MQRLENLHLVTHFGQIGRAGQTGRTAADNGYLAPVGRGRGGRLRAMLDVVQSPTKRSSLPIATLSPLTPRMHDPSHWVSCGQTRPQTDGSELSCAMIRACFGEVSVAQLRDELRNLQRHGTMLDAARLLAAQTTARLEPGLVEVVPVADLLEIGDPYLRVLFPDGNAGYLVCHLLYFVSGKRKPAAATGPARVLRHRSSPMRQAWPSARSCAIRALRLSIVLYMP